MEGGEALSHCNLTGNGHTTLSCLPTLGLATLGRKKKFFFLKEIISQKRSTEHFFLIGKVKVGQLPLPLLSLIILVLALQ